ncbi:MAG: hypothetical protein PVJ39_14545 [Gammaproteobacteria bacterium]|jgi:hypothetical protein
MKKEYQQLLQKALGQYEAFSLMWRDDIITLANTNAARLEQTLRPFLLGETFTDRWPGSDVPYKSALLRTYLVSPESIQILKCVDNVFDFNYPNYPEDLAFYQDGMLVYSSIAHEQFNWYE